MLRIFLPVFISALILTLYIGYGEEANTQTNVKTNQNLRPLNLDVVFPQIDEILIQHASDSAIANVMGNYLSILDSGIQRGGPINAIRIARGRFPGILRAHSQNGWSIAFAADRPRNKTMMADKDDMTILKYFADSTTIRHDKGEWLGSGDSLKYRYYKPLLIEKSCLSCHGGPKDMPSPMAKELAGLFPDDKAVGFAAGDIYGIFIVEVEWPKGKEYAFKLANKSE